ncbi:MAG: glycosyltransferase family 4 protein [Acidobacteriota bacterium]|nr:glycosyltransferase family 4 protein [Acidobacteriota bacterium]
MLKNPSILVLNQYYPPDTAVSGLYAAEICAGLAARGFDVHVVAGQPSYTRPSHDAPARESRDGVRVYRVPMGRARGRERMARRIAGYLRYLVGAWRTGRKILKAGPCSTVLAFSNPPVIGYVGARLAAAGGCRFVWVLHDIHPDVLAVSGWRLPRLMVWAWEVANRAAFRRAETVVVLSDDMKRTLVERKGVPESKVRVIPVWGIPEVAPAEHPPGPRDEWGAAEGELLLLTSGNMGVMHPLDEILDAAKRFADRPVRFVFTGEGVKRRRLEARAAAEKIDRAVFLPRLPDEQLVRLLRAADIGLACLHPGLEDLAFPSRLCAYLSAGRPVIAIMNLMSSLTRWIEETGCGWSVSGGRELEDLVLALLKDPAEIARRGIRARQVYDDMFQRAEIIEAYAKLAGSGLAPARRSER